MINLKYTAANCMNLDIMIFDLCPSHALQWPCTCKFWKEEKEKGKHVSRKITSWT